MTNILKKALVAIALALSPFAFATENNAKEAVIVAQATDIVETPYNQKDTLRENHVTQESEHDGALAAGAIATGALKGEKMSTERFCNEHVKEIVEPALAKMRGLEMDELEPSLVAQGLKTKMQYATTVTAKSFIEAAEIVTAEPESMMIVQYDQSKTGMHQGRAFAIVAGVDAKNNKVQLMNTDPKQKTLTWVDANQLVEGMKVLDKDRCPRGYLIASVPKPDEAQ